ncbi:DASH complex subunit DUO1 [Nakaseomyces bracarensis]|uniref:DASH complex subunit DUO1 n=1 Tax=Nakaseomyces bracarensis TaxID=273131 RepID=A0ABR4NPP2_9SACH
MEDLDNSAINQLIPQIFDQMRTNVSGRDDKQRPSAMVDEGITTQSLLKELETLDKIIDTIKRVDDVVKGALPSHMNKIHHVCKSTNRMLDNWINIQSQAGYAYQIMEEHGGSLSGGDLVKKYTEEIDQLKKELKQEQDKVNGEKTPNIGSRLPMQKRNPVGRVTKATSLRNARNRYGSQISDRLTRPTASSQMKRQR